MLDAMGVRENMILHKLEGGVEHRVAYLQGTARVVKDLDCNVTLTSSLWNYLTDFEIGNLALGDEVRLEGFYQYERSLHIVTSQPFVAGVHPKREVLREKVVEQFPIVDKMPHDPVVGDYYLATEELGDIQIIDLHPGNVIEGRDGRLNLIDVHFRFKTPQEREQAIRLIRGMES